MSTREDSKMAERAGSRDGGGHEAMIARARELIADPGYPTADIVEELAAMLMHHAGDPAAGN